MSNKSARKCLLGLASIAAALFSSTAQATLYINDLSSPVAATSVADGVTGAQMDGMSVSLSYGDGTSSTAIWSATGGAAGSAQSVNWSLSTSGNTFSALWSFSHTGLPTNLLSMTLSGIAAGIAFDRREPTPGTTGSFAGSDFAPDLNSDGLVDDTNWTIDYSRAIQLDGQSLVGDLFGTITVSFGPTGINLLSGPFGFSFLQDSDSFVASTAGPGPNPNPNPVPLPGTLALMLLGLGLLGLRRRVG